MSFYIIDRYPVVGVLEELNSTVALLEKKFPLFFDGFTELYENELKGTYVLKKTIKMNLYCTYDTTTDSRRNHGLKYERLSPEAEMMVRANFSREIEFYEYITQRLRRQVKEEL